MQTFWKDTLLLVEHTETFGRGLLVEGLVNALVSNIMNKREIPFGKPWIDEEEKRAVAEVLDSPILVHGPRVKQFEEDFGRFTAAPHSLAMASCTAALHLASFYAGIGPGDEVIVPAQTHIATAHAVEFCGGTCVFVDAELETGNIDIDQIELAITERTKALAVVHFLGMPVDMPAVCSIANRHNLFLVEDCALAIGTFVDGLHAGLHGDAGCFSFYPVKHITTAEGGMMITTRSDVAKKMHFLRAFGVDRTVGERKVPGVYDVPMLGYNYRMNEIEAALGVEQVKRLPEMLRRRAENHRTLSQQLETIDEISLFATSNNRLKSSYYCLSVLLSDRLAAKRFDIVAYLRSKGVGTSVYYPKPVPHMTYYRDKYGIGESAFPNALRISEHSISLPVGPHLNEDDMCYIAATLKDAVASV